jgi:predicted DNA-binding protein (UPF0251 family)
LTILLGSESPPNQALKVMQNHDISMTTEDFDAAREKLASLSGKSIELARLIWVDGHNRSEAAKLLGMSRQSAYQAIKKAVKVIHDVPADWKRIEEWAPPELEAEFRKKLAEAMSKR